MGGFIVLEDGRACAPSNRGTDLMLEEIATRVRLRELRDWLLNQRSTIVGTGLTRIDLRELTQDNRAEFRRAARKAFAQVSEADTATDDEWHRSYLEYFSDLIDMIDRVESGEPPEQFNPHMKDVIPETGHQRGPGWALK